MSLVEGAEWRTAMRKYVKRTVAFLMSVMLLVCCMDGLTVHAATQSSVTSQLNSLISQYANRTATSSQMYMGSQCKGFANWIFKQIFGVYIGPYPESANYKITNANAQLVGMINPGGLTEATSRELLQKAKPGDYIQVQRSIAKSGGRCGPHSMIVVSVQSDGVQIFDCNSDGRNTIKTYLYTWSKFDYDNRAMSLYHAYDYQESMPASAIPDTRLRAWFSFEPMGGAAENIRLNDSVYLCYRVETTDGNLLDSSVANYSVKETIYFPDGTSFPYTYDRSNNNWIRSGFNKWGTYKGVVEISGDYNGSVEVSCTIEQPKQIWLDTWFSSTKMGSKLSYMEKGKSYYLCYAIKCDNNGYLNKYVNRNYSVTEEVYAPDGTKVFDYTYDKSDNNWIRFTATQSGSYKGVVYIQGDFKADCSEVCECKDTSTKQETEHKFGAWTTVTKATCTADGSEQRKCSICGKIETRVMKATGHKYIDKVVAPTTTQKGYTRHTCINCAYSYKDNYKDIIKQQEDDRITITYDSCGGDLGVRNRGGIKGITTSVWSEIPKKYYLITLDPNGGTVSDKKISVSVPFKAWYTSPEGKGTQYKAGQTVSFTKSMTLYAAYENAKVGALPVPSRRGYTFDGWYLPSGTKISRDTLISGDCPVTAMWVENTKETTHAHTPGQWETIREATKTTVGEAVQKCQTCGLIMETKTIPVLTVPETSIDQSQQEEITTDNSSMDDYEFEQDLEYGEEEEEDTYAVGDEVSTEEAIFTITNIDGIPSVEYTELYDEDVTEVSIPKTITINDMVYQVTSVASKAFYKNASVKKVIIPATVTEIGSKAFYGCKSLKKVYILSTKMKSGKIGSKAFMKLPKNVKIYVPQKNYKVYKKLLKKAGVSSKAKFYWMKSK